jgi:hypothetical protein
LFKIIGVTPVLVVFTVYKHAKDMKTRFNLFFLAAFLLIVSISNAQDEMKTLFKKGENGSVTGYGAISNKLTHIGSSYANVAEIYGGVLINRKFMIGLSGAGTTNNIPVPLENSMDPLRRMSYQYAQAGLMTEYIMGSNKTFHIAFSLFAGSGFTMQYDRPEWNQSINDYENYDYYGGNEDFFFVAEPGVQLEINVFKWMRFSPGISYRAAFGSSAVGLTDSNISTMSYNATFKFGKF